MLSLVRAIKPDFPQDRQVVETTNFEKYWRIVNGVLNVPSSQIVRANYMLLDRYIEAVNAFAVADLNTSTYSWTNLNRTNVASDKVASIIEYLLTKSYLAVDIETRQLSYTDNKVLLIGVACSETESYMFDITQFTHENFAQLQRLFKSTTIQFIWHNGKFDTTRLKWLVSIDARVDQDTMLLHYVGINERKGTQDLKGLGTLYLQAPRWDDELKAYIKNYCRQHGIKLKEFKYDMIPIDILIPYAHYDVLATYRLYFVFKKLQRAGTQRIYETLCRASNVYRDIELAGNYIDKKYLCELRDTLDDKIVAAERQVRKAAIELWDPVKFMHETGSKTFSTVFNHKSPIQLKWMLEKATGCKLQSTDKNALAYLHATFPDIPFINAISDLRKYDKYMDTYVTGIEEIICDDGRVRCTFKLHGTETGRLSSAEPNMQNIPRAALIKDLFVAENGNIYIQFDYSQIELRVLAYLSQDDYMLDCYRNNKDLHDSMATGIFGPNFTKEQRVQAKTVNFGIPYGRGVTSIAQNLHMSVGQAAKLLRDWFAVAPQAAAFVRKMRAQPFATGAEPFTTIFGRQRHYVITNENRNGVENKAVNFPIQSTASDCTLLSVCELSEWLAKQPFKARIVNTVHDSIIVEAENNVTVIKKIIAKGQHIMESIPRVNLPNLNIPFKAAVEIGYKWGDLHEEDDDIITDDEEEVEDENT